ncbi:hypothetical protein C8R46DRAFT_196422 [Mycena filopes]|nr:hypothetical protein C8R46DRAFT_196422 [Mycena filopes]
MPAVREPRQNKNSSQGQKFASALGLQDRPDTFKKFKGVLRDLVNETFNFNLPLFQQQDAMKDFVKKAHSSFPGFFDPKHDNYKERVDQLERYAHSYLKKSGKLSTNKVCSPLSALVYADGRCQKNEVATRTPASNNDVKPRPKPKPLYRPKVTPAEAVDVPMPDAPTLAATVPSPAPPAAAAFGATATGLRVKKPIFAFAKSAGGAPPIAAAGGPPDKQAQDVVRPAAVPPATGATGAKGATPAAPTPDNSAAAAHRVKKAVKQPGEAAVPVPAGRVAAPTPAIPPTNKPVDVVPTPEDNSSAPVLSVQQFLGDRCFPTMSHRAPAFERAGITEPAHVEGMARWREEGLRKFIANQQLGCTPLELEVIFVAVSGLAPAASSS